MEKVTQSNDNNECNLGFLTDTTGIWYDNDNGEVFFIPEGRFDIHTGSVHTG